MRLRRSIILVAVLAASAAITLSAGAERLVLSISRHQVMVTSSFTGTQIVLFGTIEPDRPGARLRNSYDLVATVVGPRQTAVTRRKERVVGIWANVASRTFVNVPTYLAIMSNRPFEEIAETDLLRRQQVGLDYFVLTQQVGSDLADTVRDDPFRMNFIRLKKEHSLYAETTNGVTFLTPTVFRAEIPVPAEAPFGNYDVEVKVFSERALLVRNTTAFEIVKAGFEQFVANAARDYSFLYGLFAAAMAIATGWFASVVFRRD